MNGIAVLKWYLGNVKYVLVGYAKNMNQVSDIFKKIKIRVTRYICILLYAGIGM